MKFSETKEKESCSKIQVLSMKGDEASSYSRSKDLKTLRQKLLVIKKEQDVVLTCLEHCWCVKKTALNSKLGRDSLMHRDVNHHLKALLLPSNFKEEVTEEFQDSRSISEIIQEIDCSYNIKYLNY